MTMAMAAKRGVGVVAMLSGWLFLVIAAVWIAAGLWYRPTLEYAYAGRQQTPLPHWLTGELLVGVLGGLFVIIGGVLVLVGRRWRRL